MTYQMTRLRLRSIGHPDSRYRDLTIPVCDADGSPVDSLLWLVNGGGKTSLLSLIFALIVPLRRDFMGADDQERALEEYVQSGDTAHVAIEWVDLDAGGLPGLDATLPRIVTGMVHEWQGRSAPSDRAADKQKLTSFYYAFTAQPGGLDLDSLPVEEAGRPRTVKDFADQLREGGRAGHGAADLETFLNRRTAWSDYLEENLGIDPGLYRYQVRMNAAEGAVARLFRFQSGREFIEFLIDFTAGQSGASVRALETTTENVRTLLDKLATKPALAVEQRFSLAAAERLEEVQRTRRDQLTASAAHRGAHERAATVSASLVASAGVHERAAGEAETDDGLRTAALTGSEAGLREAQALAAEFGLAEARLASIEAEQAEQVARAEAAEAETVEKAWVAVPTLADLSTVEAQLAQLRERLSQEDQSARPVRRLHDRAATRLRRALGSRIEATAAVLGEHALAVQARRAELDGLERAERAARDEAVRAAEAGAQRREQAAGAARKAAAEVNGPDVVAWRTGPTAEVSVAGVSTVASQADTDHETAISLAVDVGLEVDRTRAALSDHEGQLPTVHAALREAQAQARSAHLAEQEALDAVRALALDPRLRALAEAEDDDELDLHAAGPSLLARLNELRHQELSEYALQTAAAGAHQAVVAAVGATGFAPPSGETAELIEELRRAGVDARAGWQVLRELVPGPTEAVAALRSDQVAVLAAGLVVPPAQLQEVTALLAREGRSTAGVVALTDRPALTAALSGAVVQGARSAVSGAVTSDVTGGLNRVQPDAALYDTTAAQAASAERERQAEQAAGRAAEAKQRSDDTGRLAETLRHVLAEFPAPECLRRQAETRRTAELEVQAAQRLQQVEADRSTLAERLVELTGRLDGQNRAAAVAGAAHSALQRALGLLEEEAGHRAAATDLDRAGAEAAERAAAHRAGVDSLRDAVERLEEDRRGVAATRQALERELDDVRHLGDDPSGDDPGSDDLSDDDLSDDDLSDDVEPDDVQVAGIGADLDRLRADYATLRAQWQQQTSASDAARQLEEAEARRAQLRHRLPVEQAVLVSAADLLAGPEAATETARAHALSRAQEAAKRAEVRRVAAEAELATARADVRQRRPAAAEHHATLPSPPQTRAEAREGADQAQQRVQALQEVLRAQQEELQQVRERCMASRASAEALLGRARMLDQGRRPVGTDEPLLQAAADQRLVASFLGQPGVAVVQPGRLHEEEARRTGATLADGEIEAALEGVRVAAAETRAMQDRVTTALNGLRRLGARAEFNDVPDAIRNRVLAAENADLLESAGRLAGDLQQRASLIAQQLAGLSEDTEMVVERLVSSVRSVLADLNKAERYARMPEDTGTWSGRSFLTVRTGPMPEPSLVAERIRPVLERFALNPDALTPMTLLKECVLAGAGGPQAFRVKVLKPNAAGQDHVDITKLQKFSGGEKLTVCVALYCVLAKLRAHNAGREGGGGTLVLDNPLGTASHTNLLSLQRKVAAAHGVQLVYATGVNDLAAVGEFSHRVRLRKTWHAAINRSYVDRTDEPTSITAAHVGQPDTLRAVPPEEQPPTAEPPAE